RVLVAWAQRYVSGLAGPEFDSLPQSDGEEVIVAEAGSGKFTQLVNAAGHPLVADEPLAFGGDNRGPSPYGLLLASLGACTAMTLRMYADHKGLPLERVLVRLKHDKIHVRDCADCDTRDGKVDVIRREITLTGDLDAATRARLLEIADRCPVHRTLHSEVKVETRLADQSA
ncbi:MAG: OsmC family peroxiredoxin, partial [Alphaproteobacteria bacterium]